MQIKFWETWYKNRQNKEGTPSALEVDLFICAFAEDFMKKHKDLYEKDIHAYWQLFRQEQQKEWTAYQSKKK